FDVNGTTVVDDPKGLSIAPMLFSNSRAGDGLFSYAHLVNPMEIDLSGAVFQTSFSNNGTLAGTRAKYLVEVSGTLTHSRVSMIGALYQAKVALSGVTNGTTSGATPQVAIFDRNTTLF